MRRRSVFTLIMLPKFERAYRRFARKHPELRQDVLDVFTGLREDPFAPTLRLHALKGTLSGFQAISLNYEYRIVLCVEVRKNEVILHDIGTHDEVYG